MERQNAPGREAEGAVCLHSRADTDANTIAAIRIQRLTRFGIPYRRANLIAGLCFGEVRHAG